MASRASPPSAQWDGYKDAEWVKINDALRTARLKPLTANDRETLNWIARTYRELSQSTDRPTGAIAKRWTVVAKGAAKLKSAILDAKEQPFIGDPFFWAAWDGYDRTSPDNPLPEMEAASFEEILEQYERTAKLIAGQVTGYIKPEAKKNLGVQFYQEVLRIWFEHGGKISYSTSQGKPSGPLISYFRAVTQPAMNSSAPANETIKSFLVRTKKAGKDSVKNLGPTWLGELRAIVAQVR